MAEIGEQTSERNPISNRKWKVEKTKKIVTPLPPSDPYSPLVWFLFVGSLNLGSNMLYVWVFSLDWIEFKF